MLELADRLLPLVAAGERMAVATSIDVIGSAPHLAGTSMAVTGDGRVIGSVSGGCVEEAALADCRALLDGRGVRLRRYGFGDDAAARAGLACGGEVDVLVHGLVGGGAEAQLRAAAAGQPAAIAVVVSGGPLGLLVTPGDDVLGAAVQRVRDSGSSGIVEPDRGRPGLRLFVDVAAPARRLVIGGATETAAALVRAAVAVGYRVVVCDPRPAFAQRDRFPGADRIVAGRVHELLLAEPLGPRDAVCVLGHDEDLDPLALAVALDGAAGFVGALGSRSTAELWRQALLALGTAPEDLARLRMPIGLDLGGRTPAETAVSIIAEVLAVRAGRAALPLAAGSGPIHDRPRARTAAPVSGRVASAPLG